MSEDEDKDVMILRQADEIETLRQQVEDAGKKWEFALETWQRRCLDAEMRAFKLEVKLERLEAREAR